MGVYVRNAQLLNGSLAMKLDIKYRIKAEMNSTVNLGIRMAGIQAKG